MEDKRIKGRVISSEGVMKEDDELKVEGVVPVKGC
jgi:hypothetical protein